MRLHRLLHGELHRSSVGAAAGGVTGATGGAAISPFAALDAEVFVSTPIQVGVG